MSFRAITVTVDAGDERVAKEDNVVLVGVKREAQPSSDVGGGNERADKKPASAEP